MAERKCETCQYWHKITEHLAHNQRNSSRAQFSGQCRRRAPTAVRSEGARPHFLASAWPPTISRDWCGEWEQDLDQVEPVLAEDLGFGEGV